MNRISIDVTPEQHQRLKALAALQGKSVEQFVLESTLGIDANDDLSALEALLDQRHREALVGVKNSRSVSEIFQDARRKLDGRKPDA